MFLSLHDKFIPFLFWWKLGCYCQVVSVYMEIAMHNFCLPNYLALTNIKGTLYVTFLIKSIAIKLSGQNKCKVDVFLIKF